MAVPDLDMNPWHRLRAFTCERWMLLLTFLWMVTASIFIIAQLDNLDDQANQQLVINRTLLRNIEDCTDPDGACAELQLAIENASRKHTNQVALYSAYCAVRQVQEQQATIIRVADIQECVDTLIEEDARRARGGEFPVPGADGLNGFNPPGAPSR